MATTRNQQEQTSDFTNYVTHRINWMNHHIHELRDKTPTSLTVRGFGLISVAVFVLCGSAVLCGCIYAVARLSPRSNTVYSALSRTML